MNEAQKSILQMARGAIQERSDYEMSRIMENILDPNTKATEKRKLTLTLEFKPDDTRQKSRSAVWQSPLWPRQTLLSLRCMWRMRTPLWKWVRRFPGNRPWTDPSRKRRRS